METLPDLPRVLNKREAKKTPKVLDWFKTNYHSNCAIEIKVAQNKSPNTIPEKALQDHQKKALMDAKHGSLVHKIADTGMRNPFDAFMLCNSDAFVVACFTQYGYCLVFDIDDWRGARYDDEALFRIKL